MNLLFVSASFEKEWRAHTINFNSHYPLGLGYLHSYLESKGHTVHTLFLNDYPYDECRKKVISRVKSTKPDIVGFNILTNNRTSSFRLIEVIHKRFPGTRILIGGIHTSVMYEQIVKKYPYIIAVVGEGELTTEELLDAFTKKKPIKNIAGIAYKDHRNVVKTPERELIENLDTLPFPKHEIFFSDKRTIACLLTSRGCPFHCSFCVLDVISRRHPRKRSVENVIAEIQHLKKTFPQLETVWIHDDQFFLDNKRVIEFCKIVVKKHMNLHFICSGRFKPVSKEMVDWLVKAGFVQVLFGLESGSNEILEKCHKGITQDDVLQTVKLFRNTPIFTTMFLITGLVGETLKTVRESYEFVKKVQKEKYTFFQDIGTLTIYPGTEVYDIAKTKRAIADSYWLTDKPTPFFTVEHSRKELSEFKNEMLDHIALSRILTWKGFSNQIDMIPSIVRFCVRSIPMIPFVLKHLSQRFYPGAYALVRKVL